jgi:hypothetical protein
LIGAIVYLTNRAIQRTSQISYRPNKATAADEGEVRQYAAELLDASHSRAQRCAVVPFALDRNPLDLLK